ncbi:hypothetical protein VTK56DRAFT_2982 [Thermocarpiscus australiensis]
MNGRVQASCVAQRAVCVTPEAGVVRDIRRLVRQQSLPAPMRVVAEKAPPSVCCHSTLQSRRRSSRHSQQSCRPRPCPASTAVVRFSEFHLRH